MHLAGATLYLVVAFDVRLVAATFAVELPVVYEFPGDAALFRIASREVGTKAETSNFVVWTSTILLVRVIAAEWLSIASR